MNSLSQQQTRLIEILILGVILVLAYFVASIPHIDYRYPIHSDEWMNLSNIKGLLNSGQIFFPNPINAGEIHSPDTEIGFHLLLGELKLITGISWLNMFRYLPSIIFILLAFQTYNCCKGGKLGLAAAFFITFIPTTIRFLGPGFLVPVALGLTYMPLTLFILHQRMADRQRAVLLFLLLLSLLLVHPPTLAVTSAIVVVHSFLLVLLKVNSHRRISTALFTLAPLVPIYIFMFFWAPSFVDFVVAEAMSASLHLPLPPIRDILSQFGYIPAVLFIIGIGTLVYRGQRDSWTIVLSVTVLLAFQMLYPRFHLGPDIVYERGWLMVFVLIAPVAAVALTQFWNWLKIAFGQGYVGTVVSSIIIGIVIISAAASSLAGHLREPYYRLVDDAIYSEFLWFKQYAPPCYQIGVIDDGKAPPFAAVTERFSYTTIVHVDFPKKWPAAMEFLDNESRDTSWLVDNNLNIIYTSSTVDNSDLIKVGENLYLFPGGCKD